MVYEEIQRLKALVSKYRIECKVAPDQGNLSFLTLMEFSIGRNVFHIYIDDDYGDLKSENALLYVFLVLFELENYHDSEDILDWCNYHGLDAGNDELRQYFMDLANTYASIEALIGKPDAFINSLDFELNAGPMQALRSLDT